MKNIFARMRKILRNLYRFLPIQLVLLHFRKYQLLLIFWVIVIATITGNFAAAFGAHTLFLAPEYRGEINFFSMLLLGGAMAIFVMAWHITTFIIHSQRVPFMGATKQAFLKYCINNSLIPLVFLVFYSIISIRFQWFYEQFYFSRILLMQLGFYLGFLLVILLSFAYFFRVDRDLLKVVLSRITNPSVIRELIPYDTLDYEVDIIRAETFITERFKIKRCSELEPYHPRLLATVLRRHHRNAITATIFALLILLISGLFVDQPALRIPAGAGFLILFSIMMGMVGAMKYFLRSWEVLGWVLIFLLFSWLVERSVFDLRSIAYGMEYDTPKKELPEYEYENLKKLFSPYRYNHDKRQEEQRLDNWKATTAQGEGQPPLIIVTVSGGGSRAAYWTFRSLQYIDSLSGGKVYSNTSLITGASGGMIGAAYWRGVHAAYKEGTLKNPYSEEYQENIGKDLLNAIIFSFASVDMISPFNKISIAGYSYPRDRGYAMEQELIRNSEGIMDKKLGDFKEKEAEGKMPAMVINSTIINDGRRLMVCAQPIAYLTRAEYTLQDTVNPPIDGVDFAAFFATQNPYNLRLTTALRMNATFPFILPVVKLPSQPYMNVMDAGLRDNFGVEVATRYMHVMREWIQQNTRQVILLEIRDTREHKVFPSTEQNTLSTMMSQPFFTIQEKWEPFQSYYHGYLKDFAPHFVNNKFKVITLQYIPEEKGETAALNFHLTAQEKQDIAQSIYHPINQAAIKELTELLRQ